MYNRRLVFSAACLGMLIFGIVLTTLGAILPSVIGKFGVDKTVAGSLMFLLTLGILIGSLVFGPIVDRYGYKSLLSICAALIFLGLEGVAFATHFWMLRMAAFIIGFGGGVINGGTNALVADITQEAKSASLSILGVFFGLGAIGVPLLLGSLLNVLSYEFILAGVGIIVLLPLLFFLYLRFPKPKQEQGFPIRQSLNLLKDIPLILFGLILFFESGMEITIGSWTALFFSEEMSIEAGKAVLFLSFYWLGMVLMRLLLGYLLKTFSPVIIQFFYIAIALTGTLALLLWSSLFFALAGLFLIGCGFAAGFPVMLGYVGNIYSRLSGTAFSIVFVVALLGGMTLPYLTGIVADSYGLRVSFITVLVGLSGMTVLFLITIRKISTLGLLKTREA